MAKLTKKIQFSSLAIGGGSPISIQSMLNASTVNEDAVLAQMDALIAEGCDVVRLAIEDAESVEISKKYVEYAKKARVLLVADIQFDYRLAVKCCEAGFEKIRFNPGNIGSDERVATIVEAARANNTAVRIGVNGGSLAKKVAEKYGDLRGASAKVKAAALAESALTHLDLVTALGLERIVLSVKSSDAFTTVFANRILTEKCDYPLHIGVTESGMGLFGEVKSAVGVGALLVDGIGDTVRVSLTGDPTSEVKAAQRLLRILGLRSGCQIVSCPTCSRCKTDLESVVKQTEILAAGIIKPVKIAIMGCAVNGPGEAADADFGVAFGDGKAAVFAGGKVLKTVETNQALAEIKAYIDSL